MTNIIMDGYVKIWSVPTIANIAAPTVAELNAGLNIGQYLTRDGLQGFEPDTASVDTTNITSTYGTNEPGLAALGKGTLMFLAQTQATEVVRPLFIRGYTTNIVVRRSGLLETAAWGASQWLEVWKIRCGARRDGQPASNETLKYGVEVFFYEAPNQNAISA